MKASTLDRREFLRISAMAVGGAVAAMSVALDTTPAAAADPGAGTGSNRASARPNILVFLTDDHGQWAQHCNGNAELITPNLDALAASGTGMTGAYTPTPVCSPARASFWTGRMPSQHGVHDWLDETMPGYRHPGLTGQTLLSELLQKAGYYTALVGKWHCGVDRTPPPGFDRWFSYWSNQYPHVGRQNFSDQGRHVVEQGAQSPLLTDHALQILADHRSTDGLKQKPFFLFVGYVDTHSPHQQAPAELVAQYTGSDFKDIPDERFADCHGEIRTGKAPDTKREHQRLAQYYGAVASVDREVGRIMDDLKKHGELENTLVVYTGDHGLNCGHHGIWEKGNGTMPQNFLEESIRIGCTFCWPAGGIGRGKTCDQLVNHCDTWATLLQIAGAVPDAALAASIQSPGQSYLPQLRGEPLRPPSSLFHEYGNARAVREGQYKLILRFPYKGVRFPDELYDLQADPRETVNRAADPAMAAVVKELTDKINRFFNQYTVPGHDGLQLVDQPMCNPGAPWLVAEQHAPRPA